MKKRLWILVLFSACSQVEIEEDKSLVTPFDLNVKSVKAYYTDEFGDQPHKNGDMVGYAYFGNDGTLMNIKTTRSRISMFQSNARWINEYNGVPIDRLLWVLDGGLYGQNWNHIDKFLTNDEEYPKKLGGIRARKAQQIEQKNDFISRSDYYVDDMNKPSVIRTSYTMNRRNLDFSDEAHFTYDDLGRVIEINSNWSRKDERGPMSGESREKFNYNTDGSLVSYTNSDINVALSRNQQNQIELIEILKNGDLLRWYSFEYGENHLRTSSQAFNRNGELEFTVDFVYEFYN